MIDFSLYLKNDIDDYRSEERWEPFIVFPVILTLLLKPKSDVELFLIPFPWQQEQPNSIYLGSEELCRRAEPPAKVRHLHFVGKVLFLESHFQYLNRSCIILLYFCSISDI